MESVTINKHNLCQVDPKFFSKPSLFIKACDKAARELPQTVRDFHLSLHQENEAKLAAYKNKAGP